MKILIGRKKNKVTFEKSIFTFQIILTKRLSLSFNIQKPISTEQFMKELKRKGGRT